MLPLHHPILRGQRDRESTLAKGLVLHREAEPGLRRAEAQQRPRLRPAERPQRRHVTQRLKEVGFALRVGPAQERALPHQRHIGEW